MKWEIAKLQTIGIEIEMNNIRRDDAARIAAEYFGTGRWEYTQSRNGYFTYSAWDANGREWKFSRDISIQSADDMKKCEMVTPICRYDDDMELIQGLVRELRKHGAVSNADVGCGVHIHIGADADMIGGHNGKSLRNLINLMASREELLIKAVGISGDRLGAYCKRVDRKFLEAINEERPETVDGVRKIWYKTSNGNPNEHYCHSRYRMLNYHSIGRTHTIEFRLFQFDSPSGDRKNGLHAGMLKAYVQLCLVMSQYAKEARSISSAPVQLENPKFAMRTWMNRMGMIGDEFKTAHEIYRRHLDGDAGFRYGRPE